MNNTYQYGKVTDIAASRDGKIRKVSVTYRNHHENINRETQRTARELVVIHAVDELNIIEELGKIALSTDMMYKAQ